MPLIPALGDAYRNIVVTTGTGSGGVPGTTTARAVDAQFNIDAGYGISLVADTLNNKVTIVNTGNGTGALTTITESNSNGAFYPIFTRGPTTTLTFTTAASDYVSATRPAGVAELRITGSINSPTGVVYELRTGLAGLLPGQTFQAVRTSDSATINFTVGTASPINGIPQSSATYSTINGYWTVVLSASDPSTETYSSITIPTGVGNINPVTGTYQMDTMYLDQTTTPMSYNPNSSTLSVSNLNIDALVTNSALVGANANFTDWPNAKLVASQANTGDSHTYNFGVVGEATGSASDSGIWGVGVYGRGNTNTASSSTGILGDGGVGDTSNTQPAIGVRGYATDTHAAGRNIALYASASNSSVANIALLMSSGDIQSNVAQIWTLADNQASALSFDAAGKTGILVVKTTDAGEGVTMSGTLGVTGATTLNSTLGVTVTSSSDALSVTYNPASTSGAAISVTGKDSNGGVGYFDFLKVTNTTSGATNPNKSFRVNSTGALEIINSAYGATIFALSDAGHLTVEGVTSTGATGTGKFVFDTAPTITDLTISGTSTSITNVGTFSLRDTSAAFDLSLVSTSSTALTAGRILTLDVANAARTLKLAGNIDIAGTLTTANTFTTAGNFTLTLTTTASTNATLPAGTVTLAANDQTVYLGTTGVAINRASAAGLSLAGVSIDGSAGKSTNLIGGNSTTLLGSIGYQSDTDTTTLLSPNTTTTKKFLRQTGDGTNGIAPAWDTVTATDVGLGNVTNESKATMFTDPSFTGTVSDAKGGLRSIPQNSQAGAYILVIADAGKHVSITTGGVTVPSGVFAIGDSITIYNNSGTAQTITQGGSVTMYQAGTTNTGNRTLNARGLATVFCVAANTFVITGAGLI